MQYTSRQLTRCTPQARRWQPTGPQQTGITTGQRQQFTAPRMHFVSHGRAAQTQSSLPNHLVAARQQRVSIPAPNGNNPRTAPYQTRRRLSAAGRDTRTGTARVHWLSLGVRQRQPTRPAPRAASHTCARHNEVHMRSAKGAAPLRLDARLARVQTLHAKPPHAKPSAHSSEK